MPTEYQEDSADVFEYANDWRELLDPPAEDNISNSALEAVLVGVVAANKIRSCARHFLGYSYCDAGSPYKLYRDPPAAHPRWNNLFAHGVSFRGLNPLAEFNNTNNSPYVESPFDPDLRTSKFEKVVVTVRYRSAGRMRFLPDADIGDYADEWKRYVKWQTVPSVEALSADGGSQLKFAETATTRPNPPAIGANGTAFAAPIAVLLSKCNFVMSWFHVPHSYISTDPDILIPSRILNIMGKVNSEPFLGFAAGVLLAQPPTFEEVLFPVCAADSYDLITGWNVHIPFSYFNPDTDAAGARVSVPGSTYRGHNLMPFRNGGFYLATRDGVAAYSGGPPIAGERLLPGADFNSLFKHQAAP